MSSFLLTISLILNILAFAAILLLYLRQNRLLEAEKTQERNIEMMEEMLSHFMVEMKEENDAFLDRIKPRDNAAEDELAEEAKNEELPFEINLDKAKTLQAVDAYRKSTRSDKDGENQNGQDQGISTDKIVDKVTESSLLNQAVLLQSEGLSITEIAKKLNKGETEIELLLKFRQI
ncbi:acetyl/propionyl-CoA carboxylase alpha subunit [Cytobacillus horneckiae]|uniref:Swarming motility protein SwrB n=1 Tax=Cytobacillus horneckiae TaxID=549687 RepID=A0A2N0ZLZ6_9BACI|nr:hypothetical protein [Cytobacillus horneckiae]MBN6887191.1 hypothetical protein [Cytobacillus horneckiae]MCM3178218.1 hypothetical protein [Cytobacillus horneckiae]MEC1157042.1 hypothetical protein [Cytobacillus horneckiae]MED2939932.1 hypothetical protein [Cytobacillus horneckiae]PKG30530.1 hypothetical protein CWS20_02655 [Cytobacillus horneckiae]